MAYFVTYGLFLYVTYGLFLYRLFYMADFEAALDHFYPGTHLIHKDKSTGLQP